MRKLVCIGLIALVAEVPLISAQGQVATVTSSAPFRLRGANVSTDQGVPYWPVLPGDTIQSGASPVVLTLRGGSTVTMEPGSFAKVTWSGQVPAFELVCGAARYSRPAVPALKLNDPASPPKLSGVYSLSCKDAAGGWWTPGHVGFVAGALTVAGVGLGTALAVNGGVSVSPCECQCPTCGCY